MLSLAVGGAALRGVSAVVPASAARALVLTSPRARVVLAGTALEVPAESVSGLLTSACSFAFSSALVPAVLVARWAGCAPVPGPRPVTRGSRSLVPGLASSFSSLVAYLPWRLLNKLCDQIVHPRSVRDNVLEGLREGRTAAHFHAQAPGNRVVHVLDQRDLRRPHTDVAREELLKGLAVGVVAVAGPQLGPLDCFQSVLD